MPVLLAPLVVIGLALISFILLLMYERAFGSPLQGLANSVPVIGGYIARGLGAAIDYGKALFASYVEPTITHTVKWLDGLRQSVEGFVDSVNAYLVSLPGQLDHLLHVSVHDVVKAFVNPVRDAVHDVVRDVTGIGDDVGKLKDTFERELGGIEGTVKQSIDHATNVIRNVDLPHFLDHAESFAQGAADVVAGDVAATRDWAAGWIDDLLARLEDIPLDELLTGAAAGTAAFALAQVIANEAGLGRAECRAKVKQICATDPRAWEALLGLAIAPFAFPGLRALAEVGATMVQGMHDVVREIAES